MFKVATAFASADRGGCGRTGRLGSVDRLLRSAMPAAILDGMDGSLDRIGLSHVRAAQGVILRAADLVESNDPVLAAAWRDEAAGGHVSDRSLREAVRRFPQLGE